MYDPGPIPLSCLDTYLRDTAVKALKADRFPMTYTQCQHCGHIFNTSFDPEAVKYAEGTTIMYNNSTKWSDHIVKTIKTMRPYVLSSPQPMILEIGAGDGVFLKLMLDHYGVEVMGFDPGTTDAEHVIPDYFVPATDLIKYEPSLIVCRHVLEHLLDPRDFLLDIYYWCNQYKQTPYLYFEVPNFENAYKDNRIQDLVYGHVSNFVKESFIKVFELSGFKLIQCEGAFDNEVLVGIFQPVLLDRGISQFNKVVKDGFNNFNYLEDAVVWGGSGKCASFLNMYNLMCIKHVVDSDAKKHGKYVPGTGQLITSPTTVQEHETIIIPNVWRASDIYDEIKIRNLKYKQILVPVRGNLHEYNPAS